MFTKFSSFAATRLAFLYLKIFENVVPGSFLPEHWVSLYSILWSSSITTGAMYVEKVIEQVLQF